MAQMPGCPLQNTDSPRVLYTQEGGIVPLVYLFGVPFLSYIHSYTRACTSGKDNINGPVDEN